jgi:hypothetical protein
MKASSVTVDVENGVFPHFVSHYACVTFSRKVRVRLTSHRRIPKGYTLGLVGHAHHTATHYDVPVPEGPALRALLHPDTI